MITFDHVAVSGETLKAATEHVENALGVPLQTGGEHAVFHTHNTLLGLQDGLYLEAIAINPNAPRPDRPRWFDLDRFSGVPQLTNWICRTDDIDAALARMPSGAGHPVALQRGDLKWRMAVPQSGALPFDNCWPALIQWDVPTHPADHLTQQGVRLQSLRIAHPDVASLEAALDGLIEDPRVQFEHADTPGLRATFETPHGLRHLS